MNEIVGQFMAFRGNGNGDEIADSSVLIEVTAARTDGTVEIAFDAPLAGTPRYYVGFRLSDLLAQMLCNVGEKE